MKRTIEIKKQLLAVAPTSTIYVREGKGSMRGALNVFVYDSNRTELDAICDALNARGFVNLIGNKSIALNDREFSTSLVGA